MIDDKITATTIKLRKDLYAEFKILGIRKGITLQDFAERAVYLFVHDEKWRDEFNEKFSPTGTVNLEIFSKYYTGSLS